MHALILAGKILPGEENEWANHADMVGLRGKFSAQYNPIAWKHGSYSNTLSKHHCLQRPLPNPCYIHFRLLFAILMCGVEIKFTGGEHAVEMVNVWQ
jgi:hypothetical protein